MHLHKRNNNKACPPEASYDSIKPPNYNYTQNPKKNYHPINAQFILDHYTTLPKNKTDPLPKITTYRKKLFEPESLYYTYDTQTYSPLLESSPDEVFNKNTQFDDIPFQSQFTVFDEETTMELSEYVYGKPYPNNAISQNNIDDITKSSIESNNSTLKYGYSDEIYSNKSSCFKVKSDAKLEAQNNFNIREIRKVRFTKPQIMIVYDDEESSTLYDSEICEIKPTEREEFFKKILNNGRSNKKQTIDSPTIKKIKDILLRYKNSCAEFEENINSHIISLLKDSLKNEKTFTEIHLSNIKSIPKNIKSFTELLEYSNDLKVLDLNNCSLDDQSIREISYSLIKNECLSVIDISNNPDITEKGIKYIFMAISKLRSFSSINLSGINIKSESAKWIHDGLCRMNDIDNMLNISRSISLYMDSCSFSTQSLERVPITNDFFIQIFPVYTYS
ncbi:hypothetical protein BB559_006757 [Furculomyces boomerangus]|uniref:Uncharacterized protein n=1 Tax=Furculomyces boomerangus TaxID=61424 RepID=A0A2T9Y0W2_9FUNG|nr:hypothetical protein BB559_006799 [Furculomyces boomerangus]PVU85953.1 hypothetical protein BB559_006757 [Furculomyces boomerangus]